MATPSTSVRELARRLLLVEAATTETEEHEAERVCEKLRISLTRFVGADGFTALMRRSLALSRAEVPALETVKLKADGCMEGLKDLVAATGDGNEAGAALTAHFLWLLVTFVGEPIAFRLVRDAWPEVKMDD